MFVQVIKTTPSTHLAFAKTIFPIFSLTCPGLLDWGAAGFLQISSFPDLVINELKAESGPRRPCVLPE